MKHTMCGSAETILKGCRGATTSRTGGDVAQRRMCVALTFAGSVVVSGVAQQLSLPHPRGVPKPPDPGPRFFSEHCQRPLGIRAGLAAESAQRAAASVAVLAPVETALIKIVTDSVVASSESSVSS